MVKRFIRVVWFATLFLVLALLPPAVFAADPPTTAGQIVINEIMYNASSSENLNEWFEVVNATGTTLDLGGCVISDNNGSFTISDPTDIGAGEYFVFEADPDATPVNGYDYPYSTGTGGIALNNTSDQLVLTCGGTEIDRVEYGLTGWPSEADGESIEYCFQGQDNNTGTAWQAAGDNGIAGGSVGAQNTCGPTAISLQSFEVATSANDVNLLAIVLSVAALVAAGGGLVWTERRRLGAS